jgi:outer membrane protein assembly factor BamE (lipoprotein component of BamABCDE complex)
MDHQEAVTVAATGTQAIPPAIAAAGNFIKRVLRNSTNRRFMKTSIRLLFSVLIVAALSACAGTNFVRPDTQALVVGKSTAADVPRVMGAPGQVGELLRNDQKLKTTRYAYAEGAGTGLYPGVVPARAMVFSTFNDLLVAQEFVSSFPQDATDFDESKISSIVKGMTTRAGVVAVLGKPNGEAIYPVIKKQGETAAIYSYSHAKGNAFNMKFYSKALIVSFSANDVVSELEFSSSGDK